jgi:hypothetical protein
MPRFRVGDQVERIREAKPDDRRVGVVTKVIPNKQGPDLFTLYEIRFDKGKTATFYEAQLRLAKAAGAS